MEGSSHQEKSVVEIPRRSERYERMSTLRTQERAELMASMWGAQGNHAEVFAGIVPSDRVVRYNEGTTPGRIYQEFVGKKLHRDTIYFDTWIDVFTDFRDKHANSSGASTARGGAGLLVEAATTSNSSIELTNTTNLLRLASRINTRTAPWTGKWYSFDQHVTDYIHRTRDFFPYMYSESGTKETSERAGKIFEIVQERTRSVKDSKEAAQAARWFQKEYFSSGNRNFRQNQEYLAEVLFDVLTAERFPVPFRAELMRRLHTLELGESVFVDGEKVPVLFHPDTSFWEYMHDTLRFSQSTADSMYRKADWAELRRLLGGMKEPAVDYFQDLSERLHRENVNATSATYQSEKSEPQSPAEKSLSELFDTVGITPHELLHGTAKEKREHLLKLRRTLGKKHHPNGGTHPDEDLFKDVSSLLDGYEKAEASDLLH